MRPGAHCHRPHDRRRKVGAVCADPEHDGLADLVFTFVFVANHWYLALPPRP